MIRRVGFTSVLGLLAVVPAAAQTVDDIVAKNIEARGGLDRLHAVQTLRIRTIGESVQNIGGFSGDAGFRAPEGGMRPGGSRRDVTESVLIAKRPNLSSSTSRMSGPMAEAMGAGQTDVTAMAGFDGTTAWRQIAGRAVETIPDAGDAFSVLGLLVDYQAKDYKVELDGKGKADGKSCYKLRVTKKNGDQITLYIDAATHLEVMADVKTKLSPFSIRTTFRDWKPVEGILIAYTTLLEQGPVRGRTVIDKIEFNVPIDDGQFARPAGLLK